MIAAGVHRPFAWLAVVALGGLALACSGDDRPETASPGDDASQDAGGGEGRSSCSRDRLQTVVDDYFEALAAHDPSSLPLSSEVRITENGEEIEPGAGLWQTAGPARFTRTVLDPETCGTHTQAVLDEDGTDVIFGVRLQLSGDAQEIGEIETYVTRDGDYFLFDADQLAESDTTTETDLRWDDPVPEGQQATREELAEIADSYFESFGPDGVVSPIQHECYRWENGVRTTAGDCTVGLPPPGQGSAELIANRRYPIADVETGVVVGYVRFAGALDFHMFKVVDGEVRLIQAVVTDSGHDTTGWEDQE